MQTKLTEQDQSGLNRTEVDRIWPMWIEWTKLDQSELNKTEWVELDRIELQWTEWTKYNRMDKIGPNQTDMDKMGQIEPMQIFNIYYFQGSYIKFPMSTLIFFFCIF